MRFLIISLPFSGHINPTLGIAKALVQRGHRVSFILSKQWKEQVSLTGAKFIPYDNFPDEPTQIELRKMSFKAAYKTAMRVGNKYDCLIYEMLFFPGKTIADSLNIPAVRLFSTFALNDKILKDIVDTGGPLIGLLKSNRVANVITKRILGDCKIQEDNLLSEITNNLPKLNVVFTTKEFQIDSKDFPDSQYKFIGVAFQGRTELSFNAVNNIDRPIIYISLGSMLNNIKHFYLNCIKAFGNKPYLVIISVGHKIDINGLGKIPSNIKIYPFVPQLQVLKNASLFITHGGMNSVNEAMYYGVPMVVCPLATDQPTVAKRISELNLGKVLSIKDTAEKIYETSLSVLNNTKILEQVEIFKGISKKACGVTYAVNEIEKFVKNERLRKRDVREL